MNGAALWAWVQGRSRNEQVLLGAGALALLYFVIGSLVAAPMATYRSAMEKQLVEQRGALADLDLRLAALKPEDLAAVRETRRQQVENLGVQVQHNGSELLKLRAGLVGAGQMTDVLTSLLTLHSGVRLESVESLPSEPLTADTAEPAQNAERAPAAAEFFRHNLRLTLRGQYLDIARYLHVIESLPWRIAWRELSFESQDYPQGVVTVELYTVSTDPAWLEVAGVS